MIIRDLLDSGVRNAQSQHTLAEQTKLGILRAGNSGVLTSSGHVLSSCPRQARLRLEGIVIEYPDPYRELMFEAGRTNEDSWAIKLKNMWPGIVKQEEEIGIKWHTKSGRPVTGRPDMVLCDSKGNPELGLELKLVCSLWTARDVLLENRPKYNHLIQAAHYSAKLKVPFQLWYSSRVDYAVNEMCARLCPKMGEPRSKYIEYAPYEKVVSKNGNPYSKRITWAEYEASRGTGNKNIYAGPLKITPFEAGFHLEWTEEGYLTYTSVDNLDGKGEIVETDITIEGIEAFYNLVDRMDLTDDLGPRPLTLKGDGQKAGYSICDFCSLKPLCDSADKIQMNYTHWIQRAKEVAVDFIDPWEYTKKEE